MILINRVYESRESSPGERSTWLEYVKWASSASARLLYLFSNWIKWKHDDFIWRAARFANCMAFSSFVRSIFISWKNGRSVKNCSFVICPLSVDYAFWRWKLSFLHCVAHTHFLEGNESWFYFVEENFLYVANFVVGSSVKEIDLTRIHVLRDVPANWDITCSLQQRTFCDVKSQDVPRSLNVTFCT